MADVEFSTLRLDMDRAIAHLRFSRPALGNRFDSIAHTEFSDALSLAMGREDVRAIVLSAEGKVFSAGGDFDEILAAAESPQVRRRMTKDAQRLFHTLTESPLPVIAAVQGAAIGLGATIVSLCDIVVAYRNAKIADPHVCIGLVAGDGGVIGWTLAMGVNRAKRFLLTGDGMTAAEAHALGLVTDLVESAEGALPLAMDIARRITSLPREGVEGTKRAFNRLTRQAALTVFDAGLAYEMDSIASPDVAAAIAQIRTKSR